MKKSEPPQLSARHVREVVYATISKGHPPEQSLDFVSDSARSVLGYRPSEFTKRPDLWNSLVHPDDQGLLGEGWRGVIETAAETTLIYRMKSKKSGGYVWLEDRVGARLDPNGKTIGVIGSAIDVTERKRLEDTLHESETRLRGIFDEAAIGMYRTTSNGHILLANRSLVEMLGCESFEELRARNLNEEGFGPGYPRDQFCRRIEDHGFIRGLEAVWTRKDGKIFFGLESAHVVRSREGDVMYYEGTVEDISERKRAEEKTIRVNRVLRLLTTVNQLILHESEQDSLLRKACEIIVRDGGYRMVWIGTIEGEGKTVTPLAWSGKQEDYLNGILITTDDMPGGNGPIGRAIESSQAFMCNDVGSVPSFETWRAEALKRGFHAVGSFPMHVRENVIGVLNIYSELKDCFTLEESHLLSELADDIGFSLWVIEVRGQQEVANEVIKDREYWLEESQRVARVGSYVFEIGTGTWKSSSVLDDLLGIDSSYKRDFRAWLRLIHPADRSALMAGIQESFFPNKRSNAEFRIVRERDKEVRWMWGTAEVLLDPSGKPIRLFGIAQDITDRKRTEEQLRNERILLRTLVDNLPNSIYVKDRDYRKVLANPSNVRHAGMSSEADVLGKNDFELFPHDIAEKFFDDDRRVMEHGEPVIAKEEFVLDKNGTERWQLTSKIPLRDEKGAIVGLVGIGTDITERRAAEEEKQRERVLLRTLFDHLPASIWVKDKNYRRTAVNKAHVLRTGLFSGKANMVESDFIGKTDFDLYDREKARLYFAEDQTVIRDGKTILDREELVVDSKGAKHWQLVSKVPLLDESGAITGLIGIVTDITRQKEAEEAQEHERVLLRTIIDNLPNSIFVKDKNFRKIIANPSHIHRVALSSGKEVTSESQLIGKTDSEIYPEELAREFLEEDERILQDGLAIINREYHSTTPDGQERWELVSKIPLRNDSGEITGFVGITSEITEQKLVEEALRRERILLKTIIDHAPIAIFAKDKELRKILVNPAHMERVSAYIGPHSAEDLLGKSDFEIYPPEMAEEFFQDEQRILRHGKLVLNKPMSYVDNNGQQRWELVSKIPMRDERGDISGLVGVSTDITAVRQAEEKLAESEAKFRLLAENARDIVFRYGVTPSPHFEYVSPSATEINGYTPDEHYADPELIVKITHPEDRLSLKELGDRTRKTGDPITVRWIRKDRAVIWVEIQSRPIYDRDNNLLSVEGIVRDITERKKSEAALRASEETMARITSSIRDAIYSVDGATGEFEYLSPAFQKMFGYSLNDIKEMGGRWPFLMSVLQGEDPSSTDPVTNEMWNQVVDSPPVWERWWRCKDGSLLFIEDYSVPIYDGDRLVRIDGVLRDITERKRAEDEVERERILLRTLIDNFPYAIYVKDKNYRKVIANPVDVQHFAGLSSESEIIGKTDFDIYPKGIAEKLFADDQKVIIEGQPVAGREELVVDAKGKEHWLLTTKVPLRSKDNEIIGLVGVGLDVTEKRAVDEALRQSEAELRALFESMNDVVMSIDSEGKYLKVAPTNPSLLYQPAEEVIGKTLFDVLPKELAERFASVIGETLRTGKTQTIEYTLEIGGEEKWRTANVSPLTENAVIWVARDITERKSMEKEITASEKKYRELVENALVGVYKINLSGTIIYANKAMADMLEFDSPQEMMQVSSSSLYKNIEEMGSFIEEMRIYGKTGKSKEVELVTKSGKVRNVLLSASMDKDVISGMAKDITEIRTLERQFIQTQKLEGLGNIAAGIAHDFNNILGVIVGYSDLLGQSPHDTTKFERGMQAIAKAADRGKSLVRQLLTFARKTEVMFESLILNNEVMEIEKLVEETFPRIIEVHNNLKTDLPPVLADATQIHQVLLNLCVNARDAMPKGGKLSITTGVVNGSSLISLHPDATANDYVKVQVSDSGTGMDEATRQRIFEPFFTTKGVGKGTGLGLSVVYGIIESHRGFIDVESQLDKGTTFKIYLPVLDHPIVRVDLGSDPETKDAGEGGTILVIEDEDMLRDLVRSILTSKGYDVLTAKDGDEGIAAFVENKSRIRLVISDLGLPKLNGEEVVDQIKKISKGAKIAIASGFVDPEVKSDLEKEGVTHFIQKPYRSADVLKAVRELLAENGT